MKITDKVIFKVFKKRFFKYFLRVLRAQEEREMGSPSESLRVKNKEIVRPIYLSARQHVLISMHAE